MKIFLISEHISKKNILIMEYIIHCVIMRQ